jgi:3-methyladenine DNA glycosylase/8-oxoguanine DNA glycosylase
MTALHPQHRLQLPATQPFSLPLAHRAMSSFAPCTGDPVINGNAVRKALPDPDDPAEAAVVEVREAPGGVAVTVFAQRPLTEVGQRRVATWVDRWLSLSDDRAGFLEVARGDPAMAPLLAAAEGLHQVRFTSLAEGAVYFTLTQRSSQSYAGARKRRIAAEFGSHCTLDGVNYVAFPDLDRLAGLTMPDLLPYVDSDPRALRLSFVLCGLAFLDEDRLRTGPYDEAYEALLEVSGIGPFTAHAILLRVLGRPDAVPLEMAQFSRVASAVYGDPAPSPRQLRERYGATIGWWAYLARTAIGWLPTESRAPISKAA